MTPQVEQEISRSGLSAGDKFAVRSAIGALEFLKDAAIETGVPIDQLTEQHLITWLKRQSPAIV